MQGDSVNSSDIINFWSHLRVIGNITGEIIPLGATEPVHIPQLALSQEFELANALYYMCRSVNEKKHQKRFVKIYEL